MRFGFSVRYKKDLFIMSSALIGLGVNVWIHVSLVLSGFYVLNACLIVLLLVGIIYRQIIDYLRFKFIPSLKSLFGYVKYLLVDRGN